MDQFLTRPYEKSSESFVAEEPEIEIEKMAMRDSVPKLKQSRRSSLMNGKIYTGL